MLETVCEVREVERCEEVLEEVCSLVEEVVPECREVGRQECRLKEQECSSVKREQCWPGQLEGKFPSINCCTVQYRKNSVFANRAGHFIYKNGKCPC